MMDIKELVEAERQGLADVNEALEEARGAILTIKSRKTIIDLLERAKESYERTLPCLEEHLAIMDKAAAALDEYNRVWVNSRKAKVVTKYQNTKRTWDFKSTPRGQHPTQEDIDSAKEAAGAARTGGGNDFARVSHIIQDLMLEHFDYVDYTIESVIEGRSPKVQASSNKKQGDKEPVIIIGEGRVDFFGNEER